MDPLLSILFNILPLAYLCTANSVDSSSLTHLDQAVSFRGATSFIFVRTTECAYYSTLEAIGFGDNYKRRRNAFSKSSLIGFRIFDVEVLGIFISLIVLYVIYSTYLPSLYLKLCVKILLNMSD